MSALTLVNAMGYEPHKDAIANNPLQGKAAAVLTQYGHDSHDKIKFNRLNYVIQTVHDKVLKAKLEANEEFSANRALSYARDQVNLLSGYSQPIVGLTVLKIMHECGVDGFIQKHFARFKEDQLAWTKAREPGSGATVEDLARLEKNCMKAWEVVLSFKQFSKKVEEYPKYIESSIDSHHSMTSSLQTIAAHVDYWDFVVDQHLALEKEQNAKKTAAVAKPVSDDKMKNIVLSDSEMKRRMAQMLSTIKAEPAKLAENPN